ncbi:hypothetical protein J6590_068081, partial [Homalodisca vitripennis]
GEIKDLIAILRSTLFVHFPASLPPRAPGIRHHTRKREAKTTRETRGNPASLPRSNSTL